MDAEVNRMIRQHPHHFPVGRRSMSAPRTLVVRMVSAVEHYIARGLRASEIDSDDIVYLGF
ncbi:MAG: hypothetical protein NVS1B2_24690 [Vulcanimicrobiaceae bacterium]